MVPFLLSWLASRVLTILDRSPARPNQKPKKEKRRTLLPAKTKGFEPKISISLCLCLPLPVGRWPSPVGRWPLSPWLHRSGGQKTTSSPVGIPTQVRSFGHTQYVRTSWKRPVSRLISDLANVFARSSAGPFVRSWSWSWRCCQHRWWNPRLFMPTCSEEITR